MKRFIKRSMSKVFTYLLNEIRKFGATVVYADSGRLILSTNKSSLDEATVSFMLVNSCHSHIEYR